ncbi:DUF485 domain-containing protein [Rummeliibacillus sp. NPDC094406]|uniref:DUF485 domain-containing protein n=1 Tax=Rummeliibacillus sp. NPDC094406 TaxID=3364511 RepID=UPI00380791DE
MSQDLSNTLQKDHALGQEKATRQSGKGTKKDYTPEEYVSISESSEFKALVKKKTGFILPISILFLGLYILLPILTSFTSVLDGKAIGDITWVWIYSLGLFIMTWILCMTYVKKAASFDEDANKIIEKAKDGGY